MQEVDERAANCSVCSGNCCFVGLEPNCGRERCFILEESTRTGRKLENLGIGSFPVIVAVKQNI